MIAENALQLKHISFVELFDPKALARLDDIFLTELSTTHHHLYTQLQAYRAGTSTLTTIETSEFLIHLAQILEQFLANLFDIEEAVAISQAKTTSFNPISTFKKYFVLRRAKKEAQRATALPDFESLNHWLNTALDRAPIQSTDKEMATALLATHYLNDADAHAESIEKLVQWCIHALKTSEARQLVVDWSSFKLPERIDHQQLVDTCIQSGDTLQRLSTPEHRLRFRDGFKLTDPRMSAREVQDEINYCIYCHDHEGDFCSKGFPVKKGDPTQGFKKNPLAVTLTGCPLEEKISEMHALKRDGHTLAALAMVMLDNPMCPATGHRICNDCMKACIYQKQTPVNIPQIETRVLVDVLALPWGVEIYDLLTRWNPLRQTQWVIKPYNGLKIMIAGMGPAGFTLAHHLLMEGFAVVGFDGLKIEPLPAKLIHEPVRDFNLLKESLDERLMAGFGGVAEYGITVRWDKNFLKLIYLSLRRRAHFQVFGGVRFGGTMTVEKAWEMGFDHFVVAVGAGLPKALSIPGSLAPGMRQANDFLMALQLGNAAKSTSISSLQVRLPAVVIGGGLTGVDTATEVQAYYLIQIEKILTRYEILVNTFGENAILDTLDPASREILDEYLAHARLVRAKRLEAAAQGRQPNLIALLQQFGGVTIAYRRSLQESPAYIHNHEELQKALEEGVRYAEALEPAAVQLDQYGHCAHLICHQRRLQPDEANNPTWVTTAEEVILPARSILVATGTQPNTAYEFEHKGTFNRIHLQYQHYEDEAGELKIAHGVEHCKDPQFGPFTSYQQHANRVSLVGDTHPVFHGSVVKAIASGMRTYPKIVALLKNRMTKPGDAEEYQAFAQRMRQSFETKVISVTRKTPTIVELTIQAPLAAKQFQTGQFYRLQNFETLAPTLADTTLQMEPLALAAVDCDKTRGLLTFIITENSTAAKLCALLRPGEPVALMGPTGVRAKIPTQHETILILGDASSFGVLRQYGRTLREAGNHVFYVCQLNTIEELYCQAAIEAAADRIIWVTPNTSEMVITCRPQDKQMIAENLISALLLDAKSHDSATQANITLPNVDRILVSGTTDLLRQFQAARQKELKALLIKDPIVLGSVYGNMQCMLKGVCAQCLQWQINPETGERTKAVFACSWQDQPLEIIDIDHMDARQFQNRLHEQLNQWWLAYLFSHCLDKII